MNTSPSDTQAFYRSQSYWLDSVPESLVPRESLETDTHADVVIIGAGYSGMWTAWYLKKHAPDLDIVILEAEIAGFGASGRNGGWCSSYLGGLEGQMAKPETSQAAIALQRLMIDTVSEVGRVCEVESIDCHFAREGHVSAAVLPSHLARDREHVEFMHKVGFADDFQWLSDIEVRERVNIAGVLGGFFMPHVAAIHPARLARGLAQALENKGVRIYEKTAATAFDSKVVSTAKGKVAAETVLLAVEGFSNTLPGLGRKLIAVHSSMMATEPLTEAEIDETGLRSRSTWNNGKHMSTYGQLTADGRIAFGHRGRYLYNGKVQERFDRTDPLFKMISEELFRFFPCLSGKRFTHAWGGPMGVSRTLTPAVCFNQNNHVGWAGGYFGDGVGASNLAGRTLADLVLGRDTERSNAMWVNPEREKALNASLWEPEPIRWVGVQARRKLMEWADHAEINGHRQAGVVNWALQRLFPG